MKTYGRSFLKSIISILIISFIAVCLFGCEGIAGGKEASAESGTTLKTALICQDSGGSKHDKAFCEDFSSACKDAGLVEDDGFKVHSGVNDVKDYRETVLSLIDDGYKLIFFTSSQFEEVIAEMATGNPDVDFCVIGGSLARAEKISNLHNAYAEEYKARYLSGVAAGLKLSEMIDNNEIKENEAVLGYVGTFTKPDVISAYTAFFLGVRSACKSATMKVTFTGSVYDDEKERSACTNLITSGCKMISSHNGSDGIDKVCENSGIVNIPFNDPKDHIPSGNDLISAGIDLKPYFSYAVNAAINGKRFNKEYIGTFDDGISYVTAPNDNLAVRKTNDKLEEAVKNFAEGKLHVFDTKAFKADGKELKSYMVNINGEEKEAVADGYFHECEFRPAPYFDIFVDGIELLDTAF